MVKKAIIYVPGLYDDHFLNSHLTDLLPYFWKRYGYEVCIVRPEWQKGKHFSPKLTRILNKIGDLSKSGYTVTLFGQSAGGAAVLNAFSERTNRVSKVVTICGRLKRGNNTHPSLAIAAKGNPAFADSVTLFETQNEKKLTKADRRKVLTIKLFWDDVVPSTTVALPGATNITIPIIQHSIGGISALTLFSKRIVSFLSL